LRLETLEDRLVPSSYYVAINGSDSNSGLSVTQPFATIQHGLDSAIHPSDTVYTEAGTYHEQLTLSASGNAKQGPITLTSYQGQQVILDGSGQDNDTAIAVTGSYVTISGLQIENVQPGQDAEGITIEGNASHVTLANDVVTNVQGQGASGIFVNGTTNPRGTLSSLTITGNQVYSIESNDLGGAGTYGIYLYDPTSGKANIANVTITGNQVHDLTVGNAGDDCSGLRVEGAATGVTLSGNVIHDVDGPEAMGITIYGTSATPVANLTISHNQVHDCQLGMSEALTLNGNITGFYVTNNLVHDVSNIGIDLIGGDPTIDSGHGVARSGTVSGNTVYNAHSSYGGGFAAGIYVDGGRNVVLTDNITHNNDIGLEVGAENHGITATGITVSNNMIYANDKAGLGFGGYQATVGRVVGCYFVNNTVWNNDTMGVGDGQLWIQDASNNVVANNIFVAVGSEVLIASYPDVTDTGNRLDYNLYYTSLGANDPSAFTWNNKNYSGFAAYRAGAHEDAHSIFADPRFVNASGGEFALLPGSPALHAGTSMRFWYAAKDFNGQTRALPPDRGAY
jgi:hypothetical protein